MLVPARVVLTSFLAMSAAGLAAAQTPLTSALTYQGELTQVGQPVNGTATFTFRLFGVASGGVALGSQTFALVPVEDGRFTVLLNAAGQLSASAFNGERRWLELEVNGTLLLPRQEVTAAPYSLRTRAVDWSGVENEPVCFPLCLPFSGSIAAGVAFSITATSASDVGFFTINNAASAAECVDASSNGGGNVVEAAMTGTGRAGLFQINNDVNGNDAIGATSNGSGDAISAVMSGMGRAGIFENTNASNSDPALEAFSSGSPTGNSGTFQCFNTGGGRAAYLESDTGGIFTLRVRNLAMGGGSAELVGHVNVIGNLSASGTKPFRIDHPLEPANRYLYHYALESPEVLNVYRGRATLDEHGEAEIELPPYFSALNRQFEYQLTPLGAAMPNLHVAAEIEGLRFGIAGGQPGRSVSWQVTATRNDAYVQLYGAPVEVEKPPHERGRFLHPELHGATEYERVGDSPAAAEITRR